MQTQDIPSEVAGPLVAALREIKNVGFDSKNPFHKNEYASLPGVLNAVRPVLAKHGFIECHELTEAAGGVAISVHLIHESGFRITYGPSVVPFPNEKDKEGGGPKAPKMDPQGWASATTYGRRITLLAALGVTGDYDDDAEAAVASAKQPEAPAKGQDTKTKGK